MGAHAYSLPELAPTHHDLAHARLPIVRCESRRAPFGECVFPQYRGSAPFCFAAANESEPDWQYLAERVRRRDFRHSSIASRIGGVDCGTQRRAQWNVFYADACGLRRLHAEAIGRSLSDDVGLVCVRSDVETNVDHDADRFAAARLLAAEQKSEVSHRL